MRVSVIYKIPEDRFREIIASVKSGAEFFREVGMRYSGSAKQILDRRIRELGIDISHFTPNVDAARFKNIKPYEQILVENSSYSNTSNLKKRLIKDGLLENKCSECGLENWRGKEISLHLDHINGVRDDNRIENLRILCPNCHSQTETYSGKRFKKIRQCSCGLPISKGSCLCRSCCSKKPRKNGRKVKNRPAKDQLLKEIEELGYCGTGRKYGVSDNAIRKWLK